MANGFSADGLALLSRTLTGYADRGEVAGLVAMIHRGGELAQVDTAGWRDREARQPMRRDALFRMASMTKPVTAVAALQLVEQGRIGLSDPVDRWLPELADRKVMRDPQGAPEDVVPASRPITLEDLLTYRFGLGWGRSAIAPQLFSLTADPVASALGIPAESSDPDEWMRRLGELPLIAQPGELWRYHTASDVLGVLIGRITGQPFETVLAERIFEPLGMVDTGFVVPESGRERLTVLYSRVGEVLDHPDTTAWAQRPRFASGGAGLVSTVDDYARFARMILGRGELDGTRILTGDTVDAMARDRLTPAQHADPPFNPPMGQTMWEEQGFGYGVQVRTRQDGIGPGVGAVSWPGGFGTWWIADPRHDLVALLFVQSSNIIVAGDWQIPLGADFLNLTYRALRG
ncbi:beta-lactamase family protein [Nocardia sp. CA2R105]|uniref:serine hydrolase domain-containing protein n=1 Tax=Nocardia coffeae TaxID=2873381 RepID=UPI001CA67918|nr:serine hydrolase domain-containing protein [Nocardia coffeae]MBY8863133.1 beta-lactamase family protein [Nocardia coffeae]